MKRNKLLKEDFLSQWKYYFMYLLKIECGSICTWPTYQRFLVHVSVLCTIHRRSNIFKSGGHIYEEAERPSWGGCGSCFPLTMCGKFFIFKNPEVTSDIILVHVFELSVIES